MSDVTSDYERIEKRTRIHGNIRNGVIYFFLCLWALIVLFPFYWMVLTSVKATAPIMRNIFRSFHPVSHLAELRGRFYHCFSGKIPVEHFVFTVVTTAIMLVVITLAAFAFARLNFAGKI